MNKPLLLLTLSILLDLTISYPSGDFNSLTSLITAGGDAIYSYGQYVQDQKPIYNVPPFGSVGRERALLESERGLSKLDSAYTGAQQYVASFKNYQPIVDTAQEYEKYGNDGAQGRLVAKAVVDSFDGVANVVNAVIDRPKEKINHLSRSATAALNSVGRTLVGL